MKHPDTDRAYWASGYWLGHCEGYRVDGPEGRLGVVEAVVGDEDDPEALAVREGLFALRTVYVPVEDVVAVDARGRRVVLRRNPDTDA